jgi:hypothetical protein
VSQWQTKRQMHVSKPLQVARIGSHRGVCCRLLKTIKSKFLNSCLIRERLGLPFLTGELFSCAMKMTLLSDVRKSNDPVLSPCENSFQLQLLIVERDCAEQAMFFVAGTGAEVESVAIAAAVVAENKRPQSRIDNHSA